MYTVGVLESSCRFDTGEMQLVGQIVVVFLMDAANPLDIFASSLIYRASLTMAALAQTRILAPDHWQLDPDILWTSAEQNNSMVNRWASMESATLFESATLLSPAAWMSPSYAGMILMDGRET